MKNLRFTTFVLVLVSAAASARAGVTVSSPNVNDQVSSSFKLSAWAASCSSQSVTAMGYSFDGSSDTTIIHGQSIDQSISGPSGQHTLHVKAWGNGTSCVADVAINVSSGGSSGPGDSGGSNGTIVPSDATLVSGLETMSEWSSKHDLGGGGSASGSTQTVGSPSLSGSAREFKSEFSNSGDERYSLSFSDDTSSENFFYDTWVYVTSSSSNIGNLEFDINQTMSDGNTVMFGLICDGYNLHWAYTVNTGSGSHPSPRHFAKSGTYCNPRAWSQNTWHHLQAYYSRDNSGYITYHEVWLDGAGSNIDEKVFGKYSLGWGPVINTQFQIDGLGSSHATVYLAQLNVSRW